MDAINNIFQKFPQCLSNRVNFRGILLDYFPAQKVKVNLILNAYDEGIIEAIKSASELDSVFFISWKKRLIDSYGISEENADWTVDYWCTCYGTAVCRKHYNKLKDGNNAQCHLPPTSSNSFIDVSKLTDKEKFPKSIFTVDIAATEYVKLSSFIYAVRKGYTNNDNGTTWLDFTGEYTGTCKRYTLILMMIYNANNNLIGFNERPSIPKDFKGTAAFSESIYIPSDEYISKICIKLLPDS